MAQKLFPYVIVGGGLAGASAIDGIRELDKTGSILLLAREQDLPYDRPPLSKGLWTGKTKTLGEIFLHDQKNYVDRGVELKLGVEIATLDLKQKTLTDTQGQQYNFEKLLLATGGSPRRLSLPGGDLEGICYYRTVRDYQKIRAQAAAGKSAVVIGGGFIGSEMAAALNINKVDVTMIFPDECLVHRVFPESLGKAIQGHYRERGIRVLSKDAPVSFERNKDKYVTHTNGGRRIESDIVLVGVGIQPSVELAQAAGLKADNGIVVNEWLQTSHPDIYAAGDNTNFPYLALGQRTRIEHWDNSLNQGRHAGQNMAGAGARFDYMPFFFSDLFEFGYEAVGEVDSRLETVMDWQKENETGVIYYARSGKVRGVMMCNIWEKVDWARELIRGGKRVSANELPKIS